MSNYEQIQELDINVPPGADYRTIDDRNLGGVAALAWMYDKAVTPTHRLEVYDQDTGERLSVLGTNNPNSAKQAYDHISLYVTDQAREHLFGKKLVNSEDIVNEDEQTNDDVLSIAERKLNDEGEYFIMLLDSTEYDPEVETLVPINAEAFGKIHEKRANYISKRNYSVEEMNSLSDKMVEAAVSLRIELNQLTPQYFKNFIGLSLVARESV